MIIRSLDTADGSPIDYELAKAIMDRTVALVALILLLPFLALIALAIHLDSPGPILFRQRRIGQGGAPFTMYKFRTMIANADDAIHRAAFARFAQARASRDADGTCFKLQHDPRVTRVGRFLRATSLDELPQLFNVLNGTMSLVGPRPPIEYETEYYNERHWLRLTVRPGITGPWQVYARSQVCLDEMVELDLAYIAQRSILYDFKLLFLTFGAITSRKGAG